MKNEIYKNLLKLETLEEIANHAEADYERDPENREFEETFDRAYKNEFDCFLRQYAVCCDHAFDFCF